MTLPVVPDSVLEIVNCSGKASCKSNWWSCKKANLNCTDFCKCWDSCENDCFVDFDDKDACENEDGLVFVN